MTDTDGFEIAEIACEQQEHAETEREDGLIN